MPYRIVLSTQAIEDMRGLRSHIRAAVRDGLERHLRLEPNRVSRSRIKRLRGMSSPEYRLRIQNVRVYYDIDGHDVEILAVVDKQHAQRWLESQGE